MEMKLVGYGWLIDFLTSKVATWIVGLFRDKIITDLQFKYDHYISGLLDTYDLDEILEGKLLRLRAWMYNVILVFLLHSMNNPEFHGSVHPLKHNGNFFITRINIQ